MTGDGEDHRTATIYEVAARAGVSIATVSRTFSDGSKVAARTRDAVLEAAGAAEVLSPASLRDTIVTVARAGAVRHTTR